MKERMGRAPLGYKPQGEEISRDVWISLGANLGRPRAQLQSALKALDHLGTRGIESPLYKSEPWGEREQPSFLNQVFGFQPLLPPLQLLRALQEIEAAHGRRRGVKWGPRSLDLDLLCWRGEQIETAPLTLPHPRLHLRRFVLQPWSDLAPEQEVWGLGRRVSTLLEDCSDSSWLRRLS